MCEVGKMARNLNLQYWKIYVNEEFAVEVDWLVIEGSQNDGP